ncbi:M55 family metallopeptidase [Paenibacillus agricola]|uniref:TIM barrel protein n=1 Tax=Paenibacillus agricola TaxID=2716264 RepID=A0ABX0IY37_9BACL|nr:M55 family metallopeptidase [Paenibacillus agricola]NHN28865.1 TIM barrel protein [Paenibacillus agricola]
MSEPYLIDRQPLKEQPMKEQPWKRYFRLGLNHHLLFPLTFESVSEHRRTLPEVLAYPEFEIIDMFVPEDGATAEEETAQVLSSGKIPVYNCPLMNSSRRNPNSPDAEIRQETIDEVTQHLRRALGIGAEKAVIASGPNPGAALIVEQTGYFVDYVAALCEAVPELMLMIEPFDRSIGKNLLVGSTHEAAEVVRRVQEKGYPNIGLLLDMGHVPLMNETFAQAVSDSKSYIQHVHLGSCVMSNPGSPLYGDMHPPWGYEFYDIHFFGTNVDLFQLDPRVTAICGKPHYAPANLGFLDKSFDGMILLGLHAKASTPGALLNHNYEHDISLMSVNGVVVGEIGLEALMAGEAGVPLVMVTADSEGAKETEALLPGTVTVSVKQSLDDAAAACYPPSKTAGLLQAGARACVEATTRLKPYTIAGPIELDMQFKPGALLEKLKLRLANDFVDTNRMILKGDSVLAAWNQYLIAKSD